MTIDDLKVAIDELGNHCKRLVDEPVDENDLDYWMHSAMILRVKAGLLEVYAKEAVNHAKKVLANRTKIRRVK